MREFVIEDDIIRFWISAEHIIPLQICSPIADWRYASMGYKSDFRGFFTLLRGRGVDV